MTVQVVFLVDKIIRGGGETLLASLLEQSDDRVDAHVLNIGPTNRTVVGELEDAGAEVTDLGNYDRTEKLLVRPMREVVSHVRRLEPDVLHGYSNYTNVVARLAGTVVRTPVILGQHHGVPASDDLAVWANVLTNRLADATITVSDAVGDSIYGDEGSLRRSLAGGSVRTIHNGINVEHVTSCAPDDPGRTRRELNVPTDAVVVSNVGRLIPAKDQTTLVEAVDQLHRDDVYLVVVGDGPLRTDLEQQIEGTAVAERVRLAGRLSRERTLELVGASDLFVSTSVREGFGLSYLEALALGVATVASDIPAYREIGTDETTTFAAPEDPAAFASAMSRVLEDDAERETLAARGRERAFDQFSISGVASEYWSLYRSLNGAKS